MLINILGGRYRSLGLQSRRNLLKVIQVKFPGDLKQEFEKKLQRLSLSAAFFLQKAKPCIFKGGSNLTCDLGLTAGGGGGAFVRPRLRPVVKAPPPAGLPLDHISSSFSGFLLVKIESSTQPGSVFSISFEALKKSGFDAKKRTLDEL